MVKGLVTILMVVAVGFGLAFVVGCESDAQTGALIGTGVGALAGQAIGGDTKGTLIGAAVGGGAGYMIGNERDKTKTKAEMEAIRAGQNIVTVWVTNSDGSKTPVRLRKSGPNYIGPKGNYYDHLPTGDELKPVYGF